MTFPTQLLYVSIQDNSSCLINHFFHLEAGGVGTNRPRKDSVTPLFLNTVFFFWVATMHE